jgi:L-arabinose isomerase
MLLTHVGLRPAFLPCTQIDIAVVPEGDVGGALAVFVLREFSKAPVNFIEPFHIDLPNNCFAAGHAGPNDFTDPAGKTKIARDVRFAKTNYKFAGAPFAWHVFSPGIKTMLHISQSKDSFKMVCSLVESLPCEHFITSYSHGLFRPVGIGIQHFFQRTAEIGVTQHFAIVTGDFVREAEMLARLLDFEFYNVNPS